MAQRARLRASDQDREHVAERLRNATAEGRLVAEELEERLTSALRARTYGELDALVADMPRATRRSPARRHGADVLAAPALALVVAVTVLFALIVAVAFIVTGVLAVWMLWAAIGWWFFGRGRRGTHRGGAYRARGGRGRPGLSARAERYFSPSSSTARNASWGTSIRPTCFIRCLPFFCCSSSLRLRRDVAAVALGDHVLAVGLDRLPGDDPRPDRRLDRDVVLLARNLLAQLLGQRLRRRRRPWSGARASTARRSARRRAGCRA